ncbi:hypothetical protein PLEOSDRAFT_1104073 [Pleurotus ostreatus PC15]|uniref:Uncharacterized protein n=1 Tax=Pleurotus ostreatus (strain PC15) TaxID=1137138 RepID=A0A067NHA0_PLEO1|nr:hypothetical protein PLEOSDRAFT_1104073 [Pleurotus ostreatus PC15]
MSTFQYSTNFTPFTTMRTRFLAMNAYLKPSNKDSTAKVARHCARTTTKLLRQSPLHHSQHAFAPPRAPLSAFIARLLRETDTPPRTARAALTIIGWLTAAGVCPLASSSPHHLFLAVLRLVVHSSQGPAGREGDAQWVAHAGGLVSLDEVFLMRMEVQATLRTFDEHQWAVLSNAGSGDDTFSEGESSKDVADVAHYKCEDVKPCKVHIRRRDSFRTNVRLVTSRAAALLSGTTWI